MGMKKANKLTTRSLQLMQSVASGQARLFYMDARPPGFVQAERAGYLVRVDGTDRAELTEAGRAFLAAFDALRTTMEMTNA